MTDDEVTLTVSTYKSINLQYMHGTYRAQTSRDAMYLEDRLSQMETELTRASQAIEALCAVFVKVLK